MRLPPMDELSSAVSGCDRPIAGGVARRDFLKTASLVGAAVVLGGVTNANAFWFSKPRTTKVEVVDSLIFPKEWHERFGSSLTEYARFLQRLRLRGVSVTALIEPHLKIRGPVANQLPPKEMWRSMVPTLRAVDRLSQALDERVVEVISAYRTPEYNRRCGSNNASQHVRNTALDLRFKASPATVSRVAREIRDRGAFEGGVGRYRGFTHIDTRGRNADW